MVSKAHISALTAEFMGTFLLVLAVLTMDKSLLNLSFFISVTAGLVVASMMLLFGRISGAHLNPVITLGLFSVKRVTVLRTIAYITMQLVGSLAAYYIFIYFSGQKLHTSSQFSTKLLVAEALGTFLFAISWAAIVFQKLEPAKAAVIVGLSLTLAMLAMSGAGSVTLNPAVALGARSWVWGSSVLGPVVGAIVGFQTYRYLFTFSATSDKRQTLDKSRAK